LKNRGREGIQCALLAHSGLVPIPAPGPQALRGLHEHIRLLACYHYDMSVKFIQVSCREGASLDLRQARAVLRYKPDIIFLEYASNGRVPKDMASGANGILGIRRLQQSLKKIAHRDPWVKSDIAMWDGVLKLAEKGFGVEVYACDAPREVVTEWRTVWANMYPSALKNWLWWVRIYIRERYMARNIESVLKKSTKRDLTVLIFLQSFHWEHVRFLMKKPAAKEVWKYYFARFKEISPSSIGKRIRQENKLFFRHWEKVGGLSIR